MRKSLLIGALAAMAAGSMTAAEPLKLTDMEFRGIAPNGSIAASFYFGNAEFINPATGERVGYYQGSEDGQINYDAGMGNNVSNTGIVLGSTYSNLNASYWKNGVWATMFEPKPQYGNMSNGITPDGLYICGSIGLGPITLEDTAQPMLVPALWTLQADGTYGVPLELPYPEEDFSGRVPQYVTALWISDDGKTIVGQVQDYTGMFTAPIFWTCDDEGNWDYNMRIGNKLINPNDVVFPEDPGDAPAAPQQTDFMTPEELAAYNEALQAWMAAGFPEGGYPEYEDYMTAEELAAYNAAHAEWQVKFDAWSEKYAAFEEKMDEIYQSATITEFNAVALSPDGKLMVNKAEITVEDPTAWMGYSTETAPLVINTVDETVDLYPHIKDFNETQVTNDGTIYGFYAGELEGMNRIAAIYNPDKTITPLHEYVQAHNADLYAWMKENMCFDLEVEMYDWETGEMVTKTYENVWFTGCPYVSEGMEYIVTSQANPGFDEEDEAYMWNSVLPMNWKAGVEGAAVDTDVEAEAEYYTVDGIRVEDTTVPGIYIKKQGTKAVKIRK